jgi:hypothetical protein
MIRPRSLAMSLALIAALGSAGEAGQHGTRGSLLPAAKRLGVAHAAKRLVRPAAKALVRGALRRSRAATRREHQRLRAYARTYGQWLHRYNGAFPDEALALDGRFKGQLEGQVPFWDVDPATVTADADDPARPRVDLVGLAQGSPFVTRDGKLRIYTHYLNRTARKQLEETFGKPTGHVAAMMTSSFRTIILFPEDGVPFQLKFSGDEATPWGASKQLPEKQVRTSIERGLRLRKNPRVVPELAGLVIGDGRGKPRFGALGKLARRLQRPRGTLGAGLNVIYRPLPMPVQPGDRLITWHVLMSPEFRNSPRGRAMFRPYGGAEAWFRTQAAPAVADILADSLLDSFAHFELHSQNVDLLVGKDGTVRQAYAKDLLDIMHDPAAEAASGRRPVAQKVLKDGEWGDAADSGRHEIQVASLGGFYQSYFSQLGMDVTARRTSSRYAGLDTETAFRGWVMDELYTRVAQRKDVDALARFPGFESFQDPELRRASPYQAIDGLRNSLIRDQLTLSFRADPSARASFEGRPSIVSDTKANARAFRARKRGLTFGYVGDSPVAVARGADGLVRDFYFAFE